MSVVERKVPHHKMVHNLPGCEQEIEDFIALIRLMAEMEMEVLCYNWMPMEDWLRTTSIAEERGGAKVTAFNIKDAGKNVTDADRHDQDPTPAEKLWESLERFLTEVIPVAEDTGIKLALHPDDPPLPVINGHSQIVTSVDALERVVNLVPSPSNGICFCTGALGPTGEDLVEGIRRLASHIHFAHFRNITGTSENFRETWHDNGDLDMPSLMKAFDNIDYQGTIRPDHAPSMAGEPNDTPGYEMLGRLFAAGYMRGLMQAV